MVPQPVYTRADIPRLMKAERAEVFAALRSFDDRGLAEDDFAWKTFELLDVGRIPGLAEAKAAGDLPRAMAAVLQACRGKAPVERPALSDENRRLADGLLGNRFDFYGEAHPLPEDIDWDYNPGTAHWGYDLNRASYLRPLTHAYLGTGDARYARKAVELMLDWIEKNDFARAFTVKPYAFGSYLNQALSVKNWSDSLSLLASAGQVSPPELLRIMKSIHDHLAFLEIVTNGHIGNWPTVACMGMLGTLQTFPIFRDAERFALYGRSSLVTQIKGTVLPDGAQNELATHYHAMVLGNLFAAARGLRALGMDLEPQTLEMMRKMAQYNQQTIVPDGSKQVAFGDSDPAVVPRLHASLARLELEHYLRPPDQLGPELFPYAGVAFLRQRADRGDLYLAFDAGPYGQAHQHEDKLSFWLFAYGRNFIVDPGRHLYDGGPTSYYHYLMSTRAHSTILVDGEGQFSKGRPDTWLAQAPLDLGWSVSEDEVRASGVYDLGYGPQNVIKVAHHREIVFVRNRCWVIFDTLTGEGERAIESRIQFAPGKTVLDGTRVRTDFPDANLLVWPLGTLPFTDVRIEEGQENPRSGWYSDNYNKIEPSPTLSLNLRGLLPMYIATLLYPYRGNTPPAVAFTFDGDTTTIRSEELGERRVHRGDR